MRQDGEVEWAWEAACECLLAEEDAVDKVAGCETRLQGSRGSTKRGPLHTRTILIPLSEGNRRCCEGARAVARAGTMAPVCLYAFSRPQPSHIRLIQTTLLLQHFVGFERGMAASSHEGPDEHRDL